MWLVGKGRLKLKVEQCRDDTPPAITNLIRQCTEYDHEKRSNFAPEVCFPNKSSIDPNLYRLFSIRLMIHYQNLNVYFHVYNVHNQNHV